MKEPIVIIGVGEMGGVFARGFLRLGHPVFPVPRGGDMAVTAARVPEPVLVLIAVAEGDLPPVLSGIPDNWRDRIALLQNELLPADWSGIEDPTVISVWFEKKPGMDFKVILPSPVFGPGSQLVADALGAIGIATRTLADRDELLLELVVKNLYILTTNIAGLRAGGTVGDLWASHRELARGVGNEVIDLQEALTGQRFEREALFAAMVRAFEGDPAHKCKGRSAPARLARALALGEAYGLDLPILRELGTAQG